MEVEYRIPVAEEEAVVVECCCQGPSQMVVVVEVEEEVPRYRPGIQEAAVEEVAVVVEVLHYGR